MPFQSAFFIDQVRHAHAVQPAQVHMVFPVVARGRAGEKAPEELVLSAPGVIVRHAQRQGYLHQAARRIVVVLHKGVALFQHAQAGFIDHAGLHLVPREIRQLGRCGKAQLQENRTLLDPDSPGPLLIYRADLQLCLPVRQPGGNHVRHVPQVTSGQHLLGIREGLAAHQRVAQLFS